MRVDQGKWVYRVLELLGTNKREREGERERGNASWEELKLLPGKSN